LLLELLKKLEHYIYIKKRKKDSFLHSFHQSIIY